MADLELTLAWLEMPQYLDRLVRAGFESWETMLEITEQDLESLHVELGHRRILQREIANTRRLSRNPAFVTPQYDIPFTGKKPKSLSRSASTKEDVSETVPEKRGYRHHPKPDANAPERPYSAYVLFSNKMREDLKDQSLSFTEISRRVGDRWQTMPHGEKEFWKQKPAAPWVKFKSDLAEYQKTENYREYLEYLIEFKAAHATKKKADAQRKLSRNKPSAAIPSVSQPKSGSSSRDSSTFKPLQAVPVANQMAPPASQTREAKSEDSRLPISRVRKENDPGGVNLQSLRVAQACDPCRQRKTKCHGEKPVCRHCQELNIECYYGEVRRDKERKLLQDLWRKANAYEELLLRFLHQVDNDDQSTIQQCLLLPPHLEEFNNSVVATPRSSSNSNRVSEFGGGESTASGVGSMGSTDHANEENFTQGESDKNPQAFVGQASEIRWMQRLEKELTGVANREFDREAQQNYDVPASSKGRERCGNPVQAQNPTPYPEDMDTSIIGDQLDPFDVPVRSTADGLVDSYFRTVHPSFPVLDKVYFTDQYNAYFNSADPPNFKDRNFIALLQLVLAIGAVHAHLTGADWAGDDRDHLLYFAKARMLGIDTGILNDMAYLGQVQVFGLGGMYLMVTDQINRAWNIVGLALRSAQSLGMHLINTTPTLTDQQKHHRARVWYAILTLERNITVITGRPSMVRDRDCSIAMPLSTAEDEPFNKFTTPQPANLVSSQDFGYRTSTSPSSPPIQGAFGTKQSDLSKIGNSGAYFFHYVHLTTLMQQTLARLYCPAIRHMKWSEIQRRIEELDGKLLQFNATLPRPFNIEHPSQDPESESYRIALAILSHSTRTIINRPCLCRLDRRITDQSAHSNHLNHVAANKCVSSARAVLQIISNKPHNTILHRGTLWWMILHSIKRAATTVLLELAFRAEHMPSEAEDILSEAKTAINWLRGMAISDNAARRTWIKLSHLLRLAAQKIGGDASEVLSAPTSQFGETRPFGSMIQQPPHTPSDAFDPNVWQPLDNYYTGHFFGDQGTSEHDQYGLFHPNLFAPMDELSEMSGFPQMEGQQAPDSGDQDLWNPNPTHPPLGGWPGHFGGP